jgi:uncharacterized protein (DUF486 family)
MLTVLFWLALPIVLLTISNVFMTFAWYDHLKTKHETTLWLAVLVSWGIAFFEYCFQVPANRLGSDAGYSLSQLKIIQEVITLLVFCVYAVWRHGEVLRWNHFVARSVSEGFGSTGLLPC